jgi:hypothetical protein
MRPSHRHSPPSPAGSRSVPPPWQARWRRLSPLARDIVLVLVFKAVVLGGLWFAFFQAPTARQMAMEPQRVEQQIVAPRPDPEPPHVIR